MIEFSIIKEILISMDGRGVGGKTRFSTFNISFKKKKIKTYCSEGHFFRGSFSWEGGGTLNLNCKGEPKGLAVSDILHFTHRQTAKTSCYFIHFSNRLIQFLN